jgi:hypothetical protein
LLQQNSKGRKIPFCWHSTSARSRATPGVSDFWLGINGRSMWLEFKRDPSCELTPEQELFREYCAYQGIEWHRVHSAAEAICKSLQWDQETQRADNPSRILAGSTDFSI